MKLLCILALILAPVPALAQSATVEATPKKKAKKPGEKPVFEELFDGKTLDGWRGKEELWNVEDGAITGTTTDENPIKQNTFLIWDGEVANFVLKLDFRISEQGNSGIQYRSKVIDEKEFVVGGYQADIDPTMKFAGINYEEKGRGILAQRGQRLTIGPDGKKTVEQFGDKDELAKKIKNGEWNAYRIVAKGKRLSHYINGELMSEVIDHQKEKASEKGVVALQAHRGPAMKVQFKNIQLRRLK